MAGEDLEAIVATIPSLAGKPIVANVDFEVAPRVAYPVAAAQPGEIVRIAPDDPASPLGAARVERLSVLGDLLSSDRVDAVTH